MTTDEALPRGMRARVQHTLRLDASALIVDAPAHAAAAPAAVGHDVAFDIDLDRVHFIGG